MKADLDVTFYKEEKFKETPIGKIPEDWEVLPASKVCRWITDGTHDTPKPVDEGYYLVTSRHIKDGFIDFSDAYFISESDFQEVNKRSKVDFFDVLFSMIGTVGLVAIVKKNYPPFAIKNVGLFKTGGNESLSRWLYYYFQSNFAKAYITHNLKGTSQRYIPLYALRQAPIVLPPSAEKERITEILSTVDEAIQKTDEIIEKTERLKRGLMQELLTKGVGHKEFKDTEIGRIPKEWKVVKLKTILNFRNGQRPTLVENGNYPVFGANGIMGYTNEFLTNQDFILIIGRVGASGKVHLGKGKIWVSDNAIFSETYDKSKAYLPFLFHLLESKKLEQFASKTTHPIITQTFLSNFTIQLPKLIEQQKIAEILSTVDKRLEIERKRREKLERIKKALMDLLLTGKIRVRT